MSTVTSAVTTCPDLQQNLNEVFLVCNDIGIDPISLLPFLNSEANKSGVAMKVNPIPGKKRSLLVVYEQAIDDSEVDTKVGCDKTCTATTERGDLSMTVEMDCGGTTINSLIDPTNWIDSCTNTAGFAQRELLRQRSLLLDNANSAAIVTDVAGLIGAYAE
jgi:hypothetical protein